MLLPNAFHANLPGSDQSDQFSLQGQISLDGNGTQGSVSGLSFDHLYWPGLDIDLSLQSLRNPSAFPLISGAAG